MSHKHIVINVNDKGVKIEAINFAGTGCEAAVQKLTEAMGQLVDRGHTEDYFKEDYSMDKDDQIDYER